MALQTGSLHSPGLMRHFVFVVAVLVVACGHGSDPAKGGAGSSTMPTGGSGSAQDPAPAAGTGSGSSMPQVRATNLKAPEPAPAPAPPATDLPPPDGHDFTPEGTALLAVGACGDVAAPKGFDAALLANHCEIIKKAQSDYLSKWVKLAEPFFAAHVPPALPKKVVYPFAGGDLSTALTVYPDADEITTISLEPAGDPRTLATLTGKDLEAALHKIEYELKFLYRVNFSNTINMIDAMRSGSLPTQLVFGLSALKIHGYEVVALRYFKLDKEGAIHYLTDAEVADAPSATKAKAETRNFVFANAELRFKKPGGRIQIWRHIRANLGNEDGKGIGPGLKSDPRVVKHLESKGTIAGMTKAASYLLSWESFSIMRNYLIGHVQWMVSDATGVAPKWGKPAGFDYETYGGFVAPHIEAGNSISKDWRTEFAAEPKRDLAFRFGYYDKKFTNHLIIMRKKP
jgi:hypothetical protein